MGRGRAGSATVKRRRLVPSRIPPLGLIAALVVTAVGAALAFAFRGPDARAGAAAGALSALASTVAALTALYISREALLRTDQQLAHARLVTILSRRPLLLPVHQSVTYPDSSGDLADHPPTAERFRLRPPDAGAYAFVADTKATYFVPVRNAGEGPALGITGTLWHHSGPHGPLVGPSALGAGELATFTVRLGDAHRPPPIGLSNALAQQRAKAPSELFWLETTCHDVFGNPIGAQAIFDSDGLGGWHSPVSEDSSDKAMFVGYSESLRGVVDGQM